MSFTAFFLRNRHAVWALVIATVFLGIASYQKIQVRLFPDTAPPLVNVTTAWPGATASDVERDLTNVLAAEFGSIEAVIRTSATSQDNLSRIKLEFRYGTDVRLAAVDVQNAIASIRADIPAQAEPPRVLTFSSAARPVFTVGIVTSNLQQARRLADDLIAPRLQASPGVGAVQVFGGQEAKVLIDIDPKRSESHKISLSQVANSIAANNRSAPAGRLRSDQGETMLRVDQRSQRLEELEDIPIPLPDGSQLRVSDLGTVSLASEQDDSWFSIDGQRAIAVQVYRSEDANTVAVVAGVNRALDQLRTELPEVSFVAGEESASFTEQSVSNLLANVWQALLLAAVVLFLFLGRARAALVTAFTMPLAFGLTFGVMWLLGMEFNMVTLSAVILAVGMVVDASVVVLENIVRLRDEGRSPEDAAKEGTDQVLMPVLAGVATTLVVLIPLLALPGFVGRVFGPLATTLLIAFSSSVLVALVLVPILSLQIRDGGRLEAVAAKLSAPFQRSMAALRIAYLALLEFGMRRRALVLTLALASLLLGLVGLRSAGMNLLPRMDGGTFTVAFETPSGSSLSQTTAVIAQVEQALSKHEEVTLMQSQAGFEAGMQSTGSGVMGPTQGFISVTLSPRTQRIRTIWEIEQDIRSAVQRIPDVESVVIKEVGNTAKPTTLAPIVARITGPDPLVLDLLGQDVVSALSKVASIISPTRAWRSDMRRILVRVDSQAAAAMGHNAASVAQTLAAGAEGIEAGFWSPDQSASVPIKVRYSRSPSPTLVDRLAWVAFLPNNGSPVPLHAIATSSSVIEQGLFTSENLNPVLDILAEVDGRPLNFVVADAATAIGNLTVPDGYQVEITGENKDLTEARVSILNALLISILAVYLLLVAQFRSWLHPITVMMAVPLSISGVSLALWLSSKPVSMPVMVGLVLLVGTVVNNSILLVDLIRQRREAGIDRLDAIREAVNERFRPIMMTSLSTVVGMLPLAMELALGSERFSPLATAVIGGLLASTLLTLVVIPVLYDVVDELSLAWLGPKSAQLGSALLLMAMLLPSSVRAQEYTLEDAWALSQQHPVIAQEKHRVHAAEAGHRAATGRLFPSVELSARASQMSFVEPALIAVPITMPDGSKPEPIQFGESIEQQGYFGVVVSQPIFAGGALIGGRKAAEFELNAAKAARKGTRAEHWLRLVQAWYGVTAADQAVLAQLERLNVARQQEDRLQRLTLQGRATELMRSRVALKRAESEQDHKAAIISLGISRQALQSLTGTNSTPSVAKLPSVARRLAGVVLPFGQAAIVTELSARVELAEAMSKVSRAQLLPTVALRFGAQYANPNTRYFPIQTDWQSSWDASLVLSWKLDAGVRWNQSSKSQSLATAARYTKAAVTEQVALQLSREMAVISQADILLDIAAERVSLARRSLQAAESEMAIGRATVAEVLDQQATLAMALVVEQQTAMKVILAVETARTLAGQVGPHSSTGDHDERK